MNEICTDDYARNLKFVYTLKFKSHIKSYTFCTRTTGTVWQPRFRLWLKYNLNYRHS